MGIIRTAPQSKNVLPPRPHRNVAGQRQKQYNGLRRSGEALYLTGSYVRDKDGVDGAYMICEMFSYYATQGISLLDKLDELYKTYGYCLNTLHSYEFDGSAGFAKMQNIMQAFRGEIKEFGGKKVIKLLDYAPGLDGLPKSDVLKFLLEDNCSIVVRPSGTEPKLKTYISVSAENKEAAETVEAEIRKSAEEYVK